MQSESCWCQFPSQLYFRSALLRSALLLYVGICACFSFQRSKPGNTSLTRFTFLADKDLPMNGKIISLEFSCSLEITEIR